MVVQKYKYKNNVFLFSDKQNFVSNTAVAHFGMAAVPFFDYTLRAAVAVVRSYYYTLLQAVVD